MVETLVTVNVTLTAGKRGAPEEEVLRQALRGWAFNPKQRESARPAQVERALSWVSKATPPASVIRKMETLRKILDACATNLDGTPSAPSYFSRRRRVLSNVLKDAVAKKRLASNPLYDPELNWEPPSRDHIVEEVDPRVVGNAEQMRMLLTGVRQVGRTQGPRFVAFLRRAA